MAGKEPGIAWSECKRLSTGFETKSSPGKVLSCVPRQACDVSVGKRPQGIVMIVMIVAGFFGIAEYIAYHMAMCFILLRAILPKQACYVSQSQIWLEKVSAVPLSLRARLWRCGLLGARDFFCSSTARDMTTDPFYTEDLQDHVF